MYTASIVTRALLPFAIIVAFGLHWLSLRGVKSSAERLPRCRGAYLGLSAQLLIFALAIIPGHTGPAVLLIPMGMAFSFAGDYFNLQFPWAAKRVGQSLAWGIGAFMAAQACYIAAFVSIVPLSELIVYGGFIPVLAVCVVLPVVAFRLRAYRPAGPKAVMRLGFVYGSVLGAMVAVALSAAISRGGSWIAVAAGALLFLVSDSAMGETTIAGRHPVWEYQVPWMTYLAAQGLLLFGLSLAGF